MKPVMALVDISIEDDGWLCIDFERLVQQACSMVLLQLNIDNRFQINVMGCNDKRITDLNSKFREIKTATNVLSWPSQERSSLKKGKSPKSPIFIEHKENELGDIAISYNYCIEEARLLDRPFEAHISHLVVHGTLHLLGFDHILDEDARLMEKFEIEILEDLGVSNPYK